MYQSEYTKIRQNFIFVLEKFVRIDAPLYYHEYKELIIELDRKITRKKSRLKTKYEKRSALYSGVSFRPYKDTDLDWN